MGERLVLVVVLARLLQLRQFAVQHVRGRGHGGFGEQRRQRGPVVLLRLLLLLLLLLVGGWGGGGGGAESKVMSTVSHHSTDRALMLHRGDLLQSPLSEPSGLKVCRNVKKSSTKSRKRSRALHIRVVCKIPVDWHGNLIKRDASAKYPITQRDNKDNSI